MAIVEYIDDEMGIRGVLIDGYLDFSQLKQIDQKRTKKETFPALLTLKTIFQNNTPNKAGQVKVFRDIKNTIMENCCPYSSRCKDGLYPASVKGAKSVERIISVQGKEIRENVLPVFSREIEKDRAGGKDDYYFNISYSKSDQHVLSEACGGCTQSWMDFMGFKTKDVKDYANFQEYKLAAEAFLKSHLERGIEKYQWFKS